MNAAAVRRLLPAALVLAALTSCSRARPPATAGTAPETGLASWYGPDFHGRPTSNKEIYDMYDMTAAHRTLPFGTEVVVTNLENGRAATVRINDRGPFVGGRIIDLSYAAARVLGIVGPGTARVRLDIVGGSPPPRRSGGWSVQAGSFVERANAERLASEIRGRGYGNVRVTVFETPARSYFRVRLGADDGDAARDLARRLGREGYVVLVLEED